MVRLNRWWIGFVALVVVGALFIDGYSYIFRLTTGQSLSGSLKDNKAPDLLGHPVYLHRGLDLQGGSEVVVQICQQQSDGTVRPTDCRSGLKPGADLAQAQDGTVTVLQSRVNGLGVSEATVQRKGSDQVVVELPGVPLPQATDTIGKTAKLHFATAADGPPDPNNPSVIGDQQGLIDRCQLPAPYTEPDRKKCQPGDNSSDYVDPTTGPFHWKIDSALDASDVSDATAQFAPVQANGVAEWGVTINFNSKGADEWSRITTAAAAVTPRGSAKNRVAIFLDNRIITAPQVNQASSNNTVISGSFDADSARALAANVKAGALPAEIVTVASTEVSATLGSDTVRRSVIAGIVGLLVVVIFMIGYYRFPGLLASLALLLYAAIVLAFYKLIPVTVTLAGLAGFVLSVGMAVDANVLIFERTRDELRHGRSVPLAVETGFRRAFPAIRDSNVSTLLACVVLYYLGSSVVKGFALTLGLGVAVSFFSAILITQTLFALVLRRSRALNPGLYTEIHPEFHQRPPQGRFDIVRSRNLFFGISLGLLIPGILAIIFWGFNLGIDFAGGNRIDATLSRPVSQQQVQDAVNSVAGDLRPVVQAASGNTYTVSTLPSSIFRVTQITDALDKQFGFVKDQRGQPSVAVQTVGPTIASDLVRTSVALVLVSSLLIAVYLAFRFRQRQVSAWRFSVCTFLKLLHDVFVLAGLWAILGHFSSLGQVDTLFVTAVLTSVAFSIHDTIVVFDRIRENLRTGPRLTFEQIVNLSTVQTMTRSLNTALTVAFVLLSLVLFGGGSIRGFVLALLIGIIAGTYSSIFNASTLLVAWQVSDDERKGTAAPTGPRARRVQARPA